MLPNLVSTSWLALALCSCLGLAADANIMAFDIEYKCLANGTAAPNQTILNNVRTARVSVPHNPFQAIFASRQKHIAFATLNEPFGNSTLGVFNTSSLAPQLIHQVNLSAAKSYISDVGALGLTLTHDGRHILIAAGSGVVVVDAALAVAGSADAVVGLLNGTTSHENPGSQAIEVSVSDDDRFVFISQEQGAQPPLPYGNIDVIRLERCEVTNHSVTGTPVGYLTLGLDVISTSLSPDGCTMYPTSQQLFGDDYHGLLNVVDVKMLEIDPGKALLSNITTGCGASRSVLSPDGKTVWVTARYDNTLLAYDTQKAVSDPENALLANITVGTSPVGLVFARNGKRIITTDSDRFDVPATGPGLSVIDVDAALAGKGQKSVLGQIPTGVFPRNAALSPDGKTVLVVVYGRPTERGGIDGELQAIDVSSLP